MNVYLSSLLSENARVIHWSLCGQCVEATCEVIVWDKVELPLPVLLGGKLHQLEFRRFILVITYFIKHINFGRSQHSARSFPLLDM